MTETVAPKSLDPRDRRTPVGLPIEVELFYRFQSKVVRNASYTRTLEQFLIDRANRDENVRATANAIQIRAKILNVSVQQFMEAELEADGFGEFLDIPATVQALCQAWGIRDIGSDEPQS